MATLAQNQALEVIKEKVEKIEERYEGYQLDVIKALHGILVLEKSNPRNVRQQVSRHIKVLGELLVKHEVDKR